MAGRSNRWRAQSPWVLAICVLVATDLHFDLLWLSDTASHFFADENIALGESSPSEVEVTWESIPDPIIEDRPEKELSPPDPQPDPQLDETPKDEAPKLPPEPPKPIAKKVEEKQADKPKLPEQPRAMLQSIEQKSDDPTVAAPDDPRFLAQENRRVEEETVAKVRSYQKDDPNPEAGGKGAPEPNGNDQETEVADAEEKKGSDEEAAEQEEQIAQNELHQPTPKPSAEQPASTPSPPTTGQILALENGEPIAVPPHSKGSKGAAGPDKRLKLSWNGFRGAVGEKTLQEERHAYLRRKQSRIRGSDREKTFKEFRAAIENFVPNVKSGEQTALNAAASPFASYIAAIHRQIHREFADDFLQGLPAGSMSPYSDPSLLTTLEIILNADGTIHKIGVVRTSGLLPFDYGAYAAVTRAAPFPEAPDAIRSGDGRVYLHWGFYRSHRQCGTFNAEPYILPNIGGGKKPKGPVDTPSPGLAPGSKHTQVRRIRHDRFASR